MNIFMLSNYVAWILTALITALLLTDFIKNEFRGRKNASNEGRFSDEER